MPMSSSVVTWGSTSPTKSSPGYLPFSTNTGGILTSEHQELSMKSHPKSLAIFLSSTSTRNRWELTIPKRISASTLPGIASSLASSQPLKKPSPELSDQPAMPGGCCENTPIGISSRLQDIPIDSRPRQKQNMSPAINTIPRSKTGSSLAS